MVVVLEPDLLRRYRRFTLHNSPYVAHDDGRAVDLYPPAGAPSPVAGEVVDVRTVAAPPRPYAADSDHLVVVAVDWAASPLSWAGDGPRPGTGDDPEEPLLARVLHVDPAVEPGDRVAVGDHLGRRVRAGFFAPWVAPHLHVGLRAPDADPYRASGSLPLAAAVEVVPVPWDGTGRVVERGDTYAVLDAPAHPDPGGSFAGVAACVRDGGSTDDRGPDDRAGSGGIEAALDGGLPHYDGGGLLGSTACAATPPPAVAVGDAPADGAAVGLLGDRVGVVEGGRVAWDDVCVLLDGEPITGLSLFAARDGRFGAKLVSPDGPPALGATVTVSVECRSTGPRLRE